jgi:GDP-4-dehydro-6-deoxy-D-mannose reductase
MKAVITGAHGFVGRHLARHLRACGDVVHGLDLDGGEPIDVADADAVHRHLRALAPDVVYHLAARSHVGESWADEAGVERVNVGGTAAVLAAAAATGVERVLVVGSAEQYGAAATPGVPIGEDTPMEPRSPYARSKVAAEALALQAAVEGLGVVCTRAFNHTGPGQSTRFLVPALAARIAQAERDGLDAVPIGNTTPVRDVTDVRDVVRAYRLVALQGAPGAVFNVASGQAVTVGELAARLLARATRPVRLEVDPELLRPVDVPVLVGDAGRLRSATGWSPAIPLDTTLGDVLDDARGQLT